MKFGQPAQQSLVKLAGRRQIGCTAGASYEIFQTQSLPVRKTHLPGISKPGSGKDRICGTLPLLGRMLTGKFMNQKTVGFGERVRPVPLIPDESKPPTWSEDPMELRKRSFGVEPMERLKTADEVH